MNTEICNVDVEGALLGAIFINNETLTQVRDLLDEQHFFEPINREIYRIACDLVRQGKSVTPMSLKTFLPEHMGWLKDEQTGKPMRVSTYMASATMAAATPIQVPSFAKLIYDLAKRRSLFAVGQRLMDEAKNMDVEIDPKDIGEQAISNLSNVISDGDGIYGAVSFDDAMDSAIDIMSAAYSGKKSAGIPCGVAPLESLIGSLYPGQLIILGGATKQGKSALVGQIMMGAASQGSPVWFYSGEMSPEELAMREDSRETKITVSRKKRGKVTEIDVERIMQFRQDHRGLPIFIQKDRLALDALIERVKLFVRKKGKGLIIIDHILLIDRAKGQKSLQDWEFGQEVTLRLKQLARDIDCPVVACSQLKKNTFAERGPINEKFLYQIIARRPRYTDLIGAMERDADHVIMPFRPVVFLKEHEPPLHSDLHAKWEDMVQEQERKAKIVLALSRENNWPRDVDCGWDGATTTFFATGEVTQQEMPAREAQANPMGLF